jgi:hypothetical protein
VNIDIDKEFVFGCVSVYQDSESTVDSFQVKISMQVQTESAKEYNTAYERIRFWFHNIMQDCVLISVDDPRLEIWKATQLRCLCLPLSPGEHALAMMLMAKLTAITEGTMSIERVSVACAENDHVWYHCTGDEYLHWFDDAGWWTDTRPVYATETRPATSKNKVIALSRTSDWKAHDLDWAGPADATGSVSLITDLNRNEDKSI